MAIDYKVYELNNKQIMIFNSIFFIAAIVVSYLLYHNILFSFLALILYGYSKKRYIEYLIEKRKSELTEQFKDLIFALSAELCTGASMAEAMGKSLKKIEEIYGDISVIYKEVNIMHKRMINEDDVEVLRDFANRTGIEDVRDFVMIYSTCKYTGANMITGMNKAASVIIDKMTIEKEIRVLINRKKKEGAIILIMPAVIIVFLNLTAGDYIGMLYESIEGRLLMTGVIFAYIGIFKLIENITRIKV